ncbi:uncharacterized protein LOC115263103 [Aedes albopictus]|uniref:CUB domain-containing protein n=1 Tax=Aedes albopictus TaxID=7160 RepID=A0ABM1ZJ37_AEDAL|nr:uncharacterized protein LOC115263109 [Aedes albopictus]
MQCILNTLILVLALSFSRCSSSEIESYSNQTSLVSRHRREFPFFTIGRIANTQCTGVNGLLGTCQVRGECDANGGIAMGACSSLTNQAVCCVFKATCGGSGSNNVTYFQNSGFPNPYNGGGSCSYTVVPPDNTICQLRIDFGAFTLSQPNADGLCTVDNIQITGGSARVPVICGDNNGQHVYVPFSGTNSIQIRIATTGSVPFNRVWNLQLSLISCSSTFKAPAGCLQYFLGSSGSIQSFNYGQGANAALNAMMMPGTRQMANSNYGICIRKGVGICSVTYKVPTGDPYAFTVSGDAGATTPGTAAAAQRGADCTTDYLIIPNPTGVSTDRFCGLGFTTTTSNTPVFVMYYITNANDATDIGNRGFSLLYTTTACAVGTGK